MEPHNPYSRFDCPHCAASGICKANAGSSCGTCLKEAKIKSTVAIVRCDVCLGEGKVESKTDRLARRMPPIIVIIFLFVFYIYVAVSAGDQARFNQIFPVIGSLTTMIVTFYFSRK